MPESPDPTPTPDVGLDDAVTPAHRRAFAVADALNVHGSDCVCPRCAGRLPGLLTELARAIDRTDAPADARERR